MRGAGAARRRVQEAEPPPDAAAVIAKLERLSDATATLIAGMERRDAGCGDPHAALLERINLAAHWAEGREQMEHLASVMRQATAAYEAGIVVGRLREAQEREAAACPPRARHRKHRLSVVGGLAATGAVAASVAGGTLVASQESAWVHPWSPSPAAVRLHAARPDTAVLVPQAPLSSPHPSAAAASARPAPVVTARPVAPVQPPAPSPSPSVTVPAAPALDVPRVLDLGGSILGQLTLTAGAQAVEWTATATDGIRLSQSAGVAVPGQQVVLQVTDGPAGGGWVYISAGPETYAVHVTTDLGVPALALP